MAAEEKKKNQGQSALIYSKWSLTCCCRVLFVRCRLVLWIELWRSSGMASCVCVSCTRETNRYRLVRCITVQTGKAHRARHTISPFSFSFSGRGSSVLCLRVRRRVCRSLVRYHGCYLNASPGPAAVGARKAVLAEDVQERV